MKGWLHSQPFTHFVTLTFNQRYHYQADRILEYSRDKLKFFHAKLDRRLLGSKWYKKPNEERTFFMAFPEKITSNMHYHLLMSVPEYHYEKFHHCAQPTWLNIMQSGTYDCQKLDATIPNSGGYASYVTKEQYNPVNFNNMVVSTEFH
jgi:hypothetical protein